MDTFCITILQLSQNFVSRNYEDLKDEFFTHYFIDKS